ncbi:MAG: twin-arginine translocase subunit TatC [Dehalococcoidia bacterium]|nr:twin-arginine translocase subunit TatC [Dehalococcoidia bacterium]
MSQLPKEQPLRVHLEELRRRLFIAALAVAIGTVIVFVFHREVIQFLIRPATKTDTPLIFTEVTEMLGVSMKVSLMGGLILALPVVAYELVMFVSPGLTPRERRYVLLFLPAITIAFIGGVAFGYLVLIPPAMGFLLTFNADIAQPMIRIGNYISLILTLLFWMGLVFEIPVIMYVLARLRVVSYKRFAQWRKFAIVLAFVLGAVITPTFDPVNQTLVSAPIVLLYEIGIWLAWLARPKEKPPAAPGADAR